MSTEFQGRNLGMSIASYDLANAKSALSTDAGKKDSDPRSNRALPFTLRKDFLDNQGKMNANLERIAKAGCCMLMWFVRCRWKAHVRLRLRGGVQRDDDERRREAALHARLHAVGTNLSRARVARRAPRVCFAPL